MKTKLALATMVLAVAPSLALAMGCSAGQHKAEDIVMSCAEGTIYDAEAQRCVPMTTS